ncbi:MAG: ABC transporter ATP-binding protein [Tissierellia bacterium]|nr:ABC transporter ATP-binding protein [Tissierellia bacterium]
MLRVENLHVYYGGINAVRGINLHIEENQIVTLIGANGAGKTSTLRAIMSLVPMEGKIFYKDQDISTEKTMNIVKSGIALSPEGRRIFENLTVEENLVLGAYHIKDRTKLQSRIQVMYDLFPILKERSWQKAGTLSGGEQQMLAVSRALMPEPEILILDEPSLGLAPLLIQGIFDIISKLREMGNTILLVEQNANKALEIADYAYVLETGSITLEGTGSELLSNPKVQEAYLGQKVER